MLFPRFDFIKSFSKRLAAPYDTLRLLSKLRFATTNDVLKFVVSESKGTLPPTPENKALIRGLLRDNVTMMGFFTPENKALFLRALGGIGVPLDSHYTNCIP